MKNIADFVVFSDDYGRHPSSCQHLIRRFLPENRVLWVNTVGLRNPTFSAYDLKRAVEKIKEWAHPFKQIEKNLWVYSPVSLPWSSFRSVRRWNRRHGIAGIRKILKKLNFQNVVSLTTVPNVCDWVGEFLEKLKIYYCVDDFTQWPGMETSPVLEMERVLLHKTDLFVPVSKKLIELKGSETKADVLELSHGVDVAHFKKAFRNVEKRHESPVVGYFGLIDERLDFDLLQKLIVQRPEWKWIFMGPVQSRPTMLTQIKNCEFLPPVPYEELPEAIRDWDALILPYKSIPVVSAINPLKLRECLATGKPVVSLDMPWAAPYRDLVSLCRTPDQFLQALDVALAGKNGFKAEKQWDRLKPESWEMRAEMLLDAIEKGMRGKK